MCCWAWETPSLNKGISTVLVVFKSNPDMFAHSINNSSKMAPSRAKSSTTIPMSSAKARTVPFWTAPISSRSRTSTEAAKSNGDIGHPCLTPHCMPKPSYILPLYDMLHSLLSYGLRMKAMAAGGRPMHSKDSIKKCARQTGCFKIEEQQCPLLALQTDGHGCIIYVKYIAEHLSPLKNTLLI